MSSQDSVRGGGSDPPECLGDLFVPCSQRWSEQENVTSSGNSREELGISNSSRPAAELDGWSQNVTQITGWDECSLPSVSFLRGGAAGVAECWQPSGPLCVQGSPRGVLVVFGETNTRPGFLPQIPCSSRDTKAPELKAVAVSHPCPFARTSTTPRAGSSFPTKRTTPS